MLLKVLLLVVLETWDEEVEKVRRIEDVELQLRHAPLQFAFWPGRSVDLARATMWYAVRAVIHREGEVRCNVL